MTRRLLDPTRVDLAPLEQDPRYRKVRAQLDEIEQRISQAEQRRKVALARSRGQQPTKPLLERARALISGGQVVSLPPASELEASAEELSILNAARIGKSEELERVRSDISFEVCKQFASMNADALRQALDSVTSLFEALEAARVIRGRLIGAGYTISEAALPTHLFPVAAAVGNPDYVPSPAASFKAWLREKGII